MTSSAVISQSAIFQLSSSSKLDQTSVPARIMALTSAPVEIILYILQSCGSFTELRALFSTCRRIHNVWLQNAPNVVWHVAPKVIPGFDWALLAARATALVHDAHHSGRLPPEIRPDELTGELRKPSLQELDSVLSLHHFVQCIELRYCHDHLTIHKCYAENVPQNLWPEDRKPPPPITTPEDTGEGMRIWAERFHIAAYTSLLMGAVFARAYNQPFYPEDLDATSLLSSGGHPEDQYPSLEAEARRKELWDLMRKASFDRSNDRHHRLTIKEDMREYLRKFPVYDLNDELGGQEKVFGPFIEWFIRFTVLQYNKTTPKPATRDPSRPAVQLEIDRLYAVIDRGGDIGDRCPDRPSNAFLEWHVDGTPLSESFPPRFAGSPAEGEAVVWAAMQAVHLFEFILTCLTNLDGRCRFGRNCTCCCDMDDQGTEGSFTPTPTNLWITPTKTVTAKVVLFGIFQAEEILMQVDVKCSIEQQLLACTPPTHASASSPSLYPDRREGHVNDNEYLDIPLVFDDLYNRSGIANQNLGCNTPPPPLQIFTFLLEHHFNLQFDYGLFPTWLEAEQDYWLFKKRATIFAHGPELVPERSVLDYTNGMEFLVPCWTRVFSFDNRDESDREYRGNPRTWEPNYSFYEELSNNRGWY